MLKVAPCTVIQSYGRTVVRSYGRASKLFRLDGLLLFRIVKGLRFASSAIKNILEACRKSKSNCQIIFYWGTCGSPVIKCLCFFVFFFSSATKWKNCAIVPSGHWALNTMTTSCDPMRCSHADHVVMHGLGPGHMTNHEIFAYKTLLSIALYFNVFGLRSPGVLWRKRPKYLQTHTQVVLFAANPH